MRIDRIVGGDPIVSFEFLPPRDDEAEERLTRTLRALQPLRQAFVSVTYGAGGCDRANSRETVSRSPAADAQ